MNRKAHVACDFNRLFKTEGLLKVTGNHIHCVCGNTMRYGRLTCAQKLTRWSA